MMWISEYCNNENYNWAIELKEYESVIGLIVLMNIDNHNENWEIGYFIGNPWWNKEIITEAFLQIIKLSFNEVGFQRIVAHHHVDNTASGCNVGKCG